MADLQTLQSRLTEAELALHKLQIGAAVASVNYEGRGAVSYTKADLGQLQSYIADLKAQIATLQGNATSRPRPFLLEY